MNISTFESKLYLEGIRIPFTSATISSGVSVQANIELSFTNKYVTGLKPGTLVHIFIFYNGKWRIFLQGKLSKLFITESHTNIMCTSLFDYLDLARITPIDLEDSVYGYSMAALYSTAMDQVYKKKTDSELLITSKEGLSFFNFKELQKNGDTSTYIDGLLNAAKSISPWYRIVADELNLIDKYYVLNNNNIFPVTRVTTLEQLINSALQNIGTSVSYQTILNFLLRQIRYVKYELNTPVKINGEWKWVLLIPDPMWVEPISSMYIPKEKLTTFGLDIDLETPTRILMNPTFSNIEIDRIQNYDLHLLYAKGGEEPYIVNGSQYYIKFSEEEKYSGVRPVVIPFNNDETAYSVIKWDKVEFDKINTISNDELVSKDIEEINVYQKQIAEYKYHQVQSESKTTNIVPVFSPIFFPCFPIQFESSEFIYTVQLAGITYNINSNGFAGIDVQINHLRPEEKESISLEWDPDEYKDIKTYYKNFDLTELMEEKEYWKSIGVFGKRYWRRASYLNARVIATADSSVNIMDTYLHTPFVKERGVPVARYYKEIYGIELELPEPPGAIDLNTLDQGIYSTAGRDKVDKPKEETVNDWFTKTPGTKVEFASNKTTYAITSMNQSLSEIETGLTEAIGYLTSPTTKGIPKQRNSSTNVKGVLNKLKTSVSFKEGYGRWVQQESSWNPGIISDVNNKGYANYGLYQLWGGHNSKAIALYGEDEFDPKSIATLSVREQTRRVAILSKNFNVSYLSEKFGQLENDTYIGWDL